MSSDEGAGISIGILVVRDDLAYEKRVEKVLQRWPCDRTVSYHKSVEDGIRKLGESKERLYLVITNLNKFEIGRATIDVMNQTLKMNVTMVAASDEMIETKQQLSYSVYVLKGLKLNGLKYLLGDAKGVEEDQTAAAAAANGHQENSITTTSINVERSAAANGHQENAFAPTIKKQIKGASSSSPHKIKKRFTWTEEMDQKFLDTIASLEQAGDQVVPKKIVEVMGVDGLTREIVASHLQKHRISQKHRNTSTATTTTTITTTTSQESQQAGLLPSYVAGVGVGGPATLISYEQQSGDHFTASLPYNPFTTPDSDFSEFCRSYMF